MVSIGLSFGMTVPSKNSAHHRSHFLSFFHHPNLKIHHLPKAKGHPSQKIIATVMGKQHIGAVDALKRTKTENRWE